MYKFKLLGAFFFKVMIYDSLCPKSGIKVDGWGIPLGAILEHSPRVEFFMSCASHFTERENFHYKKSQRNVKYVQKEGGGFMAPTIKHKSIKQIC